MISALRTENVEFVDVMLSLNVIAEMCKCQEKRKIKNKIDDHCLLKSSGVDSVEIFEIHEILIKI